MSLLSHCNQKERFDKAEQIWEMYNIDRYEIENIKDDLELLEEGWKIHFALDFYQIYSFLHPKKESYNRNELEHEVGLRAASAFIFSELEEMKQPFILPPYVIELRNHLIYLKEEMLKMREERQYEYLLGESDRKKLEKAKKIYGEGGILHKDLMNEIVNLIDSKFPRLYRLISGEFGDEIAVTHYLLKNKRILVFTEYWDKDRDILDLIQEENRKSVEGSRWYYGFRARRLGRSMITKNVRDARAIQIVMAMNEFFREENRKEVVYLVSDARTMEEVMNWDKFDELNWRIEEHPLGIIENLRTYKDVRVLRSSRSFLAYLLNRGESEYKEERRRETIRKLTTRQKELGKLAAIRAMIVDEFEECKEKCDDPGREQQCQKIQEKIKEFEEESKKTNLYKLISQSKQLLEPYVNQFIKIKDQDEEITKDVISLIEFLIMEKEDFEEKIREETEKLDADIDQILSTLQRDIVRALSFKSFRKMTYKLRRLRGIPYKIKFKDETIKNSLKRFFDLMDEYSKKSQEEIEEEKFRDIREKWEEILKLTEDESLGIENRLLLAIILFSYKFYHEVISIKSEVEPRLTDDPDIEREFSLLECLASYRLYRRKNVDRYFEAARNTSNKCAKKYHNDPRFLNLSAILEVITDRTEKSIGKSLSLLKKAKEIAETDTEWNDNNTKSTILNNIVFIGLMKGNIDLDTIIDAEKDFKRIEGLYPQKEWDTDMLHTEGFLSYNKALCVESVDEKKILLEKSIVKFEKAKEMAVEFDLDIYRIKVAENDLKEAKAALKRLIDIESRDSQ